MPDGSTSIVSGLWEIIKYPVILIMGMMGWNLKRQVSRIDKIDEEYISHKTFNSTLAALREDNKETSTMMREGFKEMRQDIKEVHKRIDGTIGSNGGNHHE